MCFTLGASIAEIGQFHCSTPQCFIFNHLLFPSVRFPYQW